MKRYIASILAIILTLFFVSCAEKREKPSVTTSETTTDSSALDTTNPDTTKPDTTEPDTSAPDTSAPDTSVPDTSVPDTSVPDTSVPDTSVPDTSVPDTSVPDTSVPDTSNPDTTKPGTTDPETTKPETTKPETTVPGTTKPETTKPETTKPDTTVPETTAPDTTAPEPDDGVTYTGLAGTSNVTVTILDGKCTVLNIERLVYKSDEIQSMGLSGTLVELWITRWTYSSVDVSGDVLTLSGEGKAYQSVSYEGTAVEAYIEYLKKQYDQNYNAGLITKEQYDELVALNINGEEIEIDNGPSVLTAKINDAAKTVLVLKSYYENEEGKFISEYEYTADGKLTKDTTYSITKWENSASINVYYPDGKTLKTCDYCELIVDEETGEYKLGSMHVRNEYYENGNEKKNTWFNDDGSMSVSEFDEDGRQLKDTEYDANGNVKSYAMYSYGDGTLDVKEYEGEKLVSESHRIEIKDEQSCYWQEIKNVTYNSDGSSAVKEYDANGNQIKDAEYDADGNVVSCLVWTYDESERLTRYELYDASGALVEHTTYTYEGNLRIEKEYYGETLASESHDVSIYDELLDYSYWRTVKNVWYSSDGSKNVEEYDSNGDLIKDSYYDENGALTSYTVYTYDENGNETITEYYDGNGTRTRYVTYTYDGDSRIMKEYEGDVLGHEQHQVKAYDAENGYSYWGSVKDIWYGSDGSKSTEEYDEKGNVLRAESYDENGVLLEYTVYEYEGDSRVVKRYEGETLVEERYEVRIYDTEGDGGTWEIVKTVSITDGLAFTNHYVDGNIINVTVTFENGETVVVSEKDELVRDIVWYNYDTDGDGMIVTLTVMEAKYEGDTEKRTYYKETEYSAPDGEVLSEKEMNGTFTETHVSDGVTWTDYYEYCELVKQTVTFTNGNTVTVEEIDELGRWIHGWGFNADEETGVLTELHVSEWTYEGDTDLVKGETITVYRVPDGEIVDEYETDCGYWVIDYWDNGNIKMETNFSDEDIKISSTEYREDGTRCRETSYYEDGVKIFRIQEYDESGELIINEIQYDYDGNVVTES